MRAQTVDVKSSTGRILCCTVFRPGGKKLLAKGHVISDEDIRVLESEGMETIWVWLLWDDAEVTANQQYRPIVVPGLTSKRAGYQNIPRVGYSTAAR
jgi:hypothetical protein